jgi:antitoxin component YwqK of YwqJK toxin-antitoxin module
MSRLSILFVALSLMVIAWSCGGGETKKSRWQAYELEGTDTINKVDQSGLKQGIWFFYADKGKNAKQGEKPKLLVKGNYLNDKREGTWYYFSVDGTPSDTVEYQNDFPKD